MTLKLWRMNSSNRLTPRRKERKGDIAENPFIVF